MFPGYDALAKEHSAAADGRQDIFMDPPGSIDRITFHVFRICIFLVDRICIFVNCAA